MRLAPIACALAGCGTFEDPAIVLDLRVLAMKAEILEPGISQGLGPEQVIEIDPAHPPTPSEVLSQLRTTTVCALVADPGQSRRLRWSMTMCLLDDEGRCDRTRPYHEVGNGLLEDPDETLLDPQLCADIVPDERMFEVLFDAQQTDPLRGLGGIDFVIELRIGGELADRTKDLYASKKLRVSPRIPETRQANHNPFVDVLDGQQRGDSILIPRDLRCATAARTNAAPEFAAGSKITLYPEEPSGVREDYVVPTLDGHTARLTETVSYQWLAGQGAFSDEITGGGHDVLGNQSLLGTEWHAPAPELIQQPTLVPIWLVQRDERLGVSWFETCVEVVP